ncbi:ATP-dependent RNA helicase DBP10 [Rickenella mellea]|uniref:RNA helicase n=1 Tax=Rickenella mellea TaxID=50990 RepID=A0A4Y7Q9U9_9AGAM|nr:ATP-dependent RNA helicase DBP10 [Rickenella mellea]
MGPLKRKWSPNDDSDSDTSSETSIHASPRDEVDISSALTGKKRKSVPDDENDHEELEMLIKDSMARRDVKDGTKLLKKTKGKTKIAKGEIGGGSFQSMGLHPSILRSLTLRGYRVPTPIQRLSIPTLLATPPRDLVGMARTGSGKTLAYMIPLVQRLGGRHSTAFGARALIMAPARELALQVLKVGKELVRGWNSGSGDHAGDAEETDNVKAQSLRWGLVVGGEGLDEQFEMITNNPDVIIATPGRLLHLIVEMNLDLRSVQYVVFDEADRLFEMGFATALDEILHRLPASRQTLLFSATLPKSLVEFAKAGLQDPKLVRLDAESKISSDLRMAFFSVKQAEKEACLLVLLRDVIRVPLGTPQIPEDKDKGKGKHNQQFTAPHQTLVFVATKHHVEYISNLLSTAGYAVSHIYGALDQAARSDQMDKFRRGLTNILVVTDVAARGIDIPILENVVNYDFPTGARVFVHRVGRTARAGRKGWAWSFVTSTDLPHMLDLQLFLARPIKDEVSGDGPENYTENLVLGTFQREKIDDEVEYVTSLGEENRALSTLRDVMRKGQGMYERSQGKASQASYKRAKEMIKSGRWGFAVGAGETSVHPVLRIVEGRTNDAGDEQARKALLRVVNAFTPSETVFEVGTRGKTDGAALMKDRRKALKKAKERTIAIQPTEPEANDDIGESSHHQDVEMADEEEITATFETTGNGPKASKYRDSEFYMSHYQKDAMTEKGYSLKDGASFVEQARGVTFELAGDEGVAERQRRNSQMKWDKKKKKFIKGDGAGADNVKIVKTESGTRLPATYRSGRFDEWKTKTRTSVPRVGEEEAEGLSSRRGNGGGRKFKHNTSKPGKPLDKLSHDYERKVRQLKKKEGAGDGGAEAKPPARGKMGARGKKTSVRYGGKSIGRVKSELKSADQIRKSREQAERKKSRNARPSGGKGRR